MPISTGPAVSGGQRAVSVGAGDQQAGYVTGVGVGGTWFAISPTGAKVLPNNASNQQNQQYSGGSNY